MYVCTRYFGLKYIYVLNIWLLFNTNSARGKFSKCQINDIFFSYFSLTIEFDISCKLSPRETLCMTFQILFGGKI